ncbi:MAG: hypothetical protein ACI4MS_06700 [Candidatus Coproplasma sp.]
MSGDVSISTVLVGAAVPMAVAGVAVGVAVGAVGVAVGAVGVVGKSVVEATKVIVQGIADTIEDVKALREMSRQESAMKRKVFDAYQAEISADELKKEEFLNKLYSNLDSSVFDAGTLQKLKKKGYEEQVTSLDKLYAFATHYHRLNDLVYSVEKEGNHIENSFKLPKLLEKARGVALSGDSKAIEELEIEIKTLTSLIKEEIKHIRLEASTASNVEAVIYHIENNIDTPMAVVFSDELNNLLQEAYVKEEQEIIAKEELKLSQLREETLKISADIANLDYIESVEECRQLKRSIFTILADNTYSNKTKITEIEKRLELLRDKYKKFCAVIGKAMEDKKTYDECYLLLCEYFNVLKKDKPNYAFDYKNSKSSITAIQRQIEDNKSEVEKKLQVEYIRQKIYETMREYKKDFLQTKTVGRVHKYTQDIFYNGDGTVLIVTYKDNGAITMRVAGVKMEGIAEKKQTVVAGMKKFCGQRKDIMHSFEEKGIQSTTDELLEPSEQYATEIELDSSVPLYLLQKIRNDKLAQSSETQQKKRYMQ